MDEEQQDVRGPLGPAPVRRARSVRRTSTIDITWPGSLGTQMRLHGRARDVLTVAAGASPVVLATAGMEVGISRDRLIDDIAVTPARDGVDTLVGRPAAGWRLRSAVDEALPGERDCGTPLHLLLDDITGCNVIAPFAWSRWPELWDQLRGTRELIDNENVCIGYRTGSSAHDEWRRGPSNRARLVGPLEHPDDPQGWHEVPAASGLSMRRARRIDVWEEDGTIVVDSTFQDTATQPDEGRAACHEYALAATADPVTMTLTSVAADPRVLPYLECPAAVGGMQTMVGVPLAELRTVVLERLARERGCTHLNDALRALADVPILVRHLATSLRG